MFSSSLTFWGARDVLIIHPSFTHVFFFFLPHASQPSWVFILHVFNFSSIVHVWSIIWLSPKHCGLFWLFSIPFFSCTLCIHPSCRTVFCNGLFACCYHSQLRRGSLVSFVLLNERAMEITWFYEGEWVAMVSPVLLCNGLLCHRVSGSLFCYVDIVICCVCIFFLGLDWFGVELGPN